MHACMQCRIHCLLPAHFYQAFHQYLAFKEQIVISDFAMNLALNVIYHYLKFFIENTNDFNVITPLTFCMKSLQLPTLHPGAQQIFMVAFENCNHITLYE